MIGNSRNPKIGEARRLTGQVVLGVALFVVGLPSSWSAHPLVSEDTGTQGPGGNQIEVNADWVRNASGKTRLAAFTYTRGVTDNLDLIANLPRTWGAPTGEHTGFNDVSLGTKWRFFDNEGFSLGIKPEWVAPSADENRGLGNGKSSFALTFMAQAEFEDLVLLFNIGSAKNSFKLQADRDTKRGTVNRISTAALYRLPGSSTVIADIGQADAEDRSEARKSKFYVLGVIHGINKNIDLDLGYKKGITTVEVDRQWGAGLTWRFASD